MIQELATQIRKAVGAAVALALLAGATGHAQVVTTVVGGDGENMPATATELKQVGGVATDPAGNLYIAEPFRDQVLKVDRLTSLITIVAGTGEPGFSGDSGLATQASLFNPMSVVVASDNMLYIADTGNNRIRKVDLATGIITTVPINGFGGLSFFPTHLAVGGGLYIGALDFGGFIVRPIILRIDLLSGATTVVDGPSSFTTGLAVDGIGTLYIIDFSPRIRRIATNGIIDTIVGDACPIPPTFSDNVPGNQACVDPRGIALDSLGHNLYIVDNLYSRIRKVDLTTPDLRITTVAGGGTGGGDGSPALETKLDGVQSVTIDSGGTLYFGERYDLSPEVAGFSHNVPTRVRKVNLQTGLIFTAAGGGIGDGFPATKAVLDFPLDVAVGPDGNLYIWDLGHNRIRKVEAGSGLISTVAGGGLEFFDGVPALRGFFYASKTRDEGGRLALDSQRNIYFSEGEVSNSNG